MCTFWDNFLCKAIIWLHLPLMFLKIFLFFFCYVQYNRSQWALHQTLLQRFLHRHPKEALTHHQVFIRPLSGHQWETWQDGPWCLEWDDWRGMKWHIFSLSLSHINAFTLQTCQQFRAHGKWAKLTSENIKIKPFTAWYEKINQLPMTVSTRFP